jgi:hypothetical protein
MDRVLARRNILEPSCGLPLTTLQFYDDLICELNSGCLLQVEEQ